MPSASPPDGASAAGEVVEVFTGDTLEEAMASAVAALGPDLTVRRARKVRAGVRGLLGRDRYEVLAVPPDGPPALRRVPDEDEDVVGSALEALLEAADERESGPQARPVGRPVASRPLAARPASEELPPPLSSAPAGPSAPLPPAPRSSGSPLRRGGRRGTPAAGPDDEEPRRRGRLLGGTLADRSPHPDPAVAEHKPAAAPAAPARPVTAPPAPPLSVVPEPEAEEPVALRPAQVYDQDAEAEPVRPAGRPEPARRRAPVQEVPEVQEVPADEPDDREPDDREPAPRAGRTRREPEPPARPARKGARKPRTAGWSLGALSALGVPDQVLDALPGPVPRDDLAWVVALTAAIERCVPQPAEPDEQTPVVMSGHGLAGAVAVLEAGCRGVTPGTITHAGRTAPATATELALVLRHHVTGGG